MREDIKIVSDSSSDLLELEGVNFASAPLKILNDEKEYVDDANLDLNKMVKELAAYKGKVSTTCPAPGDWINAFGESKNIIAVAIASSTSGSFNSLKTAKFIYESDHPDARVHIIDSANAGSGTNMIVKKLQQLVLEGKSYDEICDTIDAYVPNVGIVFMLASVHNFANNGRVNPLIAKAIGILNIKVVAHKSLDNKIEICEKVRGDKKGLATMMKHFEQECITGKKITIGHVFNEPLAITMKNMLLEKYPEAEIDIYQLRGLCSFYAEDQGLLVAFERDYDKMNKE